MNWLKKRQKLQIATTFNLLLISLCPKTKGRIGMSPNEVFLSNHELHDDFDDENDHENEEESNENDEDNQILSEQEQFEFSLRLVEEQEKKANQFIQKATATQIPTHNQLQSKELSTISEKTECSYTANNQFHAAASNATTVTSPVLTQNEKTASKGLRELVKNTLSLLIRTYFWSFGTN